MKSKFCILSLMILAIFTPSIMYGNISAKYENLLLGKKNNLYLQKDAERAFIKMRKAALKANMNLRIVYGARNFETQKTIWNRKWEGKTLVAGKNLAKTIPDEKERFKIILNYSSVPGTSRHHWGTDIDINSVSPEYFNTKKGKAEYSWLVKNADKFGFCQPYTVKNENRTIGYNEEKWHWSYLPLAKNFLKDYQTYITTDKIKGFDGDKYVAEMNLINNYVLGVNPECL